MIRYFNECVFNIRCFESKGDMNLFYLKKLGQFYVFYSIYTRYSRENITNVLRRVSKSLQRDIRDSSGVEFESN